MQDLKWAIAREMPHLRRFARSLVRDVDAADDLVQDTLERAIKKRHLWRQRGSLRSWLFRIVYTLHLNGGAKRARRAQTSSLDDAVPCPAVPAGQEAYTECREVLEALTALDVDQRAAILLVAVEGMAYDEAATTLGIPLGTLRSRLWRGREALKLRQPKAAPARPSLRRVK